MKSLDLDSCIYKVLTEIQLLFNNSVIFHLKYLKSVMFLNIKLFILSRFESKAFSPDLLLLVSLLNR